MGETPTEEVHFVSNEQTRPQLIGSDGHDAIDEGHRLTGGEETKACPDFRQARSREVGVVRAPLQRNW